jgi:DNA-binding NarL/FixJ family response regulator
MVRVFVVSELPAIRAGLRSLVGAADDCEVVGQASHLPADAQTLEGVDVVVIDATAGPIPDELDSATEELGSGPRLVILGPVPADERLPAVLAGRPWGYLPREAGGDQLVAAVRAVASGLVAVEPSLGGALLASAALSAEGTSASGEELTEREREVLQLVALGLANKSIAARLGISEHTVKFHVAAILGKLGAGSRTEAVHLGARRGLVAL